MSPVRTWSQRRKEAAEAPSGFKPLEPGIYDFIIKEPAKLGQTNEGKTRWSINPTVESGPRANARIFHDFYDSDKPGGISYLLDQFTALGLSDLLDTEPTDEAIAQALAGRRFTAEVFIDTYNPQKPKPKLRNLRAPSSGAPVVGGALGGGLAAGGFSQVPAGPGGAPTPTTPQFQQPVQQAPVQQQAPAPQQYQQPVQQQAPAPQQYQQQAPQQQAPAQPGNPWATDGASSNPPLPPF